MTTLHRISAAALLVAALSASDALAQTSYGVVSGLVSLPGPEGQPVVVPGVTVTLTCAEVQPAIEISDEQGRFRFAQTPAGDCSIAADLQGFKSAAKAIAVRANEETGVTLRLDLEALHEEVTVSGSAHSIDSNPITAHAQTINAAAMQMAPIASERFQDALPLIPGVVRGPDGLPTVAAARTNHTP